MKVATLFAEGFEEIEAVTPIDVLKRLGVEVDLVGIANMQVIGAHGISLNMDCLLEDIFVDDYDMVILPGGLPGAYNLRDDENVLDFIREMDSFGKFVAAICAAPVVLDKAGILEDKRVTSYPSTKSEITSCAEYTGSRVEIDDNIITAGGPGCSFEFAFALAEVLGLRSEVAGLKKGMLVV